MNVLKTQIMALMSPHTPTNPAEEELHDPDATGMTTSPSASHDSTYDSNSRAHSYMSRVAQEPLGVERDDTPASTTSTLHPFAKRARKEPAPAPKTVPDDGSEEFSQAAEQDNLAVMSSVRDELKIEYPPPASQSKRSKKRKHDATQDDGRAWFEAYSSRTKLAEGALPATKSKRLKDRLYCLAGPASMAPLRYDVLPRAKWDSLTKFRKMTGASHSVFKHAVRTILTPLASGWNDILQE
jgi:hypothetical protein